jgi:hypothetical protein
MTLALLEEPIQQTTLNIVLQATLTTNCSLLQSLSFFKIMGLKNLTRLKL